MPESLREKVAAAMYVRRWGNAADPEPPPMYFTFADAAVAAVAANLPAERHVPPGERGYNPSYDEGWNDALAAVEEALS